MLKAQDRSFGRYGPFQHDEGKLHSSTLVPYLFLGTFLRFFWPTHFQGLVRKRALQIRWTAKEVLVKRLRSCLETKEETLKKFKEYLYTLNTELNEQKDKVQVSTC